MRILATRITRLLLENVTYVLVPVPVPRSQCQHTANPICEKRRVPQDPSSERAKCIRSFSFDASGRGTTHKEPRHWARRHQPGEFQHWVSHQDSHLTCNYEDKAFRQVSSCAHCDPHRPDRSSRALRLELSWAGEGEG